MSVGETYQLVLRQRGSQWYVICEWAGGDRDLMLETPRESEAVMIFEQLKFKLPPLYYSHREVQQISDRLPRWTVEQALALARKR